MLTDADRAAIRKSMADRIVWVKANPGAARAQLIAWGFYHPDGTLTERYGGPKRRRKASAVVQCKAEPDAVPGMNT